MSVIDPEPGKDLISVEESVVVLSESVQRPAGQVSRDICAECYRPLTDIFGPWRHIEARFDIVGLTGAHPAVLRIEEPVRWGFQGDKGKSNFEVNQGPSKVRDGWSGGGVA